MIIRFEICDSEVGLFLKLKQMPNTRGITPKNFFLRAIDLELVQSSGHVPNETPMPSTHLTPAKQKKAEEDVAWQKRMDRRREWAAMPPAKRGEVWQEYYEDFGSPEQSDGSHIDADGELVPDWCIRLMELVLDQVMEVPYEKG